MIKKTFIYDTSRGFAALLKQYYSDKMDIHICVSKKCVKNYKIKDFEVCFFIVNEYEDLFLLPDIYFEIEHFFVTTPKKYFIKKIENLKLEHAVIIDFDYSKKDMLKVIDYNLSRFVLNASSTEV
ncbi:hypothetical protein [Flavobacterium sp.]|uniref:hypothetical protein n=1 Tax=Flavobacterium sp. TaxID=239 RepID=UPI0024893704|nr:hypothetical protein [Flavobacterium sp.]MDI1317742.1 hypothetical protein [Flavobacterium sp.]